MITTKMTSMTPDQRDSIVEFGRQAVKAVVTTESNLSRDLIQQRIIMKPSDFKNRLEKAAREILRDMATPDKYIKEQVTSAYGYLSGYRVPKPVNLQITLLQFYDWGREVNWTLTEKQKVMVSQKSLGEGLGVIVLDESMFTNHENDPAMDYGKPMERIQGFIKKSRGNFQDYREGKWSRQYYRRGSELTENTEALWIAQGRPSGVLLVPFQFGINHAGKSVRRAREVMFGEFGLGAYEVLTLIFTHPERLSNVNDLWIDCPGDEYSDKGDGVFGHAPRVFFHDGEVGMGAYGVSYAFADFGSASGFSAIGS